MDNPFSRKNWIGNFSIFKSVVPASHQDQLIVKGVLTGNIDIFDDASTQGPLDDDHDFGASQASCPFFDVPTAFQVLDGVVTVQGASGSRKLALDEVYRGLFENSLEAGEYITSLQLPRQDGKTASAYLKLETNANDLALVGTAVRISLGWSGKIKDPRVVLGGGLNETCVRSRAAEAELEGQRPSEDVFKRAAAAIDGEIDPISDHRGSAEYRAHIGRLYTERALARAHQRLQ